jgi:hypothetical protein
MRATGGADAGIAREFSGAAAKAKIGVYLASSIFQYLTSLTGQ